jgi:hypothetical protein
VPYFHIVFTLPHELSALILQNKRVALRSALPYQRHVKKSRLIVT